MEYRITDDIDKLMAVLPPYLVETLEQIGHPDELIEIVIDLGRLPTARYIDKTYILSDTETVHQDIDFVVSRLGQFDTDNRGGIERTLHRISAIRNRTGDIVGLTCRVGRAVYGTIDIIEDIIHSGKNVLLLGAPGVGKTTMLRETARVLAETCRVVIVDTSNEIGGDGDIPHPAIGLSRRMQVAEPALQHEVMIEAVENHNPQAIIIDEIGRELEALAARTIAERGVQLIGTAHGNSLENLLRNPTLSDLVGGIQAVTLSDEEARRRRTQKTVLERRAPPTFDVLIEIQDRRQIVVHPDVAAAVDAHLRGHPLPAELRERLDSGEIRTRSVVPVLDPSSSARQGSQDNDPSRPQHLPQTRTRHNGHQYAEVFEPGPQPSAPSEGHVEPSQQPPRPPSRSTKTARIYAYGLAYNRLLEVANNLNVSIELVESLTNADALVTVKTYYRRRPKLILDAERRNIPIHVLRANTENQIENFLIDIFELNTQKEIDPLEEAMQEVYDAIRKVRGGVPSVDLKPQSAHIRRRQHDIARGENLASHSYGREPKRYVRIFQEELN
ncbi:MAG: AAA family ATPase [Chloroflexi bacterium]|nr:AAA family ATPase [Chloroflexota bacterium]